MFKSNEKTFSLSNYKQDKLKQWPFLHFPIRVDKMTETATTLPGKGAGTPETSMLGTEE